MGLLSGLTGKATGWVAGKWQLLSKEKTLTELMAEKGLNEFGRAGQNLASAPSSASAPAAVSGAAPKSVQQANGLSGYTVKFVTEFTSFDRPGNIRLSVVALNNREFKGFCEEGGELLTFSWGKVRGLMKIVDTGKMLSPYEAYDIYHWS